MAIGTFKDLLTGRTIKTLVKNANGGIWNGSAYVASTTLTTAAWRATLLACTEELLSDSTATGFYDTPDISAAVPCTLFYLLGATPSPGDSPIGVQDMEVTAITSTDLANLQSHGDSTWATATSTAANNLPSKYPASLDATDVSGNLPANVKDWDTSGSLPTIGTSTLTTSDIDARLTAFPVQKSGVAVTLPSLPAVSLAADQHVIVDSGTVTNVSDAVTVTGKPAVSLDWTDVSNPPTIGTSTLTTTDIDNRLTAYPVQKSGVAVTLPSKPAVSLDWTDVSNKPAAFAANNLPSDYLNSTEQAQLAAAATETDLADLQTHGDSTWSTATSTTANNLPSDYLNSTERTALTAAAAGSGDTAQLANIVGIVDAIKARTI